MLRSLTVFVAAIGTAALSDAGPTVAEVIQSVEAKIEPASAKPGETVKVRINVKLLAGWHTYPVTQADSAAKSQVNTLTFPEGQPTGLIFVGPTLDPADPKTKSEKALGIEEMYYYPGGGEWVKNVVISPNAKPGELKATVKFKVLACDKDNCLPGKTFELPVSVKVAGEPMPVLKRFEGEVMKVLGK